MSILKIIFYILIWGYKSFPVIEIQTIFDRFMEGIEAIYLHGR